MANTPPSLQSHERPRPRLELLLGLALAAHKAGSLEALLCQRPQLTQRLARRLIRPVQLVAGNALDADDAAAPWTVLLRATLAALRPDGGNGLEVHDAQDWTERSAWRPLLAVACHYGFMPVAALPQHYRAQPQESAADQLCGLWHIGPSTFYRHLDKGKRLLAEALAAAPAGEARLARDTRLLHEVHARLKLHDLAARTAWHARQATLALAAPVPEAALWHLWRAGDVAGVVQTLRRFRVELASDAGTDALLARLAAQPMHWRLRAELSLARAGLAAVRGDDAAEFGAYEEGLRLAAGANDALMLGVTYGALGKFHEPRDADRAFACYQDSADFLRRAGLGDDDTQADEAARIEYIQTLVKLAWLYALRNDPRCKDVLDRAEGLRERCNAPPAVLAMLEQVWGEYWRRAGDLKRALEHKHRALQVYERLGDRQSILKTWGNLALIYGDAKDFARAIEYSQRVLDMAARFVVEPETLAATHLHLGATYFWQGKYDAAIEQYRQGLQIAQRARLRLLVGRAHYNLAEAHYKRFHALDSADDERAGDAHAAAALAAWPKGSDPAAATRELKRQILGPRDEAFVDRLLPGEFAAHFEQMSEVQRHRAALALPLEPDEAVRAHLAIAQAYLDIAVHEREAAVELMQRHALGTRHGATLQRLQQTFERSTGREQQLAARWHAAAQGLLARERCDELLQFLLQGESINKSGYAQRFGVGAATASKHLAQLATLGLLQQTGRGPTTRYRLPD